MKGRKKEDGKSNLGVMTRLETFQIGRENRVS